MFERGGSASKRSVVQVESQFYFLFASRVTETRTTLVNWMSELCQGASMLARTSSD